MNMEHPLIVPFADCGLFVSRAVLKSGQEKQRMDTHEAIETEAGQQNSQ